MRCFIAIDFSDELKDEISRLQDTLRPLASSGRWKYRDNFHLTLKFLGDVNDKTLSLIDRKLDQLTQNMTDFFLNVSEIGNFPGRENIRVLWLGLNGDLKMLMNLQTGVEAQMSECGFEPEKRRYTPHVTIGQELNFKCGFEEIKRLTEKCTFPQIYADRIYLVKSEQAGSKWVYTNIHEYRFERKQQSGEKT